jgi:hypothetical protein
VPPPRAAARPDAGGPGHQGRDLGRADAGGPSGIDRDQQSPDCVADDLERGAPNPPARIASTLSETSARPCLSTPIPNNAGGHARAVFLVGPISYPGLVVQAVGRALRRYEGKTHVVVHDYLDTKVPVLKAQYSRRRVAYRKAWFVD